KRCTNTVLLVDLLRRAIEGEYHVIETRFEQHVRPAILEQRSICRHSGPNAGIARNTNHLEDLWMDHRLADTVRPDELDVILAVLDDLFIKLQVHVFVIEGIDVARAHRAIEVALRRAFECDLDWSSGQHSFVAKVARRDAQPVSNLSGHYC